MTDFIIPIINIVTRKIKLLLLLITQPSPSKDIYFL